jgi:hypothetical protein
MRRRAIIIHITIPAGCLRRPGRGALTFRLEGLTLNTVYEDLIRQISGDRLAGSPDGDIKEAVNRDERRQKTTRAITILEKKLKAKKTV